MYATGDSEHHQDFDGTTQKFGTILKFQEFLNTNLCLQNQETGKGSTKRRARGRRMEMHCRGEGKDPGLMLAMERGSEILCGLVAQQGGQPMEEKPGTLLGQYPRSQISLALPGSSLLQASYLPSPPFLSTVPGCRHDLPELALLLDLSARCMQSQVV